MQYDCIPRVVLVWLSSLDLIWDNGFIEQNNKALNEIASYANVPIILGCIRSVGNKIFNSAAIFFENNLQEYYDKILLPNCF